MSNRTADASRAVREAWYAEQRLVLEGRGTRDWTDEQQRSIAERGKAYDDRGLAVEGQHMKSVEAYPEYQGDRRNIQFLTKEEHLAAHGGNWQNHTNGYYDPVSKTMLDFGDGPPLPCAELPLTKPLFVEPLNEPSAHETSAKAGNAATTESGSLASRGNSRRWAQSLKRVAQQAWSNPRVRAAVLTGGPVVAKVAMDALVDRSTGGDRTTGPSTQSSATTAPAPRTDALHEARQAPDEHGVSGYTRKDGTSVRPHRRGGKKD